MALPLRTTCPLCGRHALDLFNDNISGGQWHHCAECRSAGDMIELASASWGCEPGTALARLSEAGVQLPPECGDPAEVSAYVDRYPAYRRRMADLWAAAKANLPQSRSSDVGKIRTRHNLKLDVSLQRWRAGPGHLVGSIGWRDVEVAFNPSSATSSSGMSSYRVFKGKHWGEVLTVPFYDLPDRIRAFMFLGREGRPHLDQVFRRLTLGQGRADWSEAGLAGIESVALAGDPASVIATDDYLLNLQVQFRNFRSSMRSIPMVVWRDDGECRTRTAWSILGGKRVVFWAREIDHRVVMQAVETDGRISTAGPATPTREAMLHYLRLRPGNDLERVVLKHAKPWAEALRAWMAEAPEGKVQDLTLRLEQAGADVSYIFRQLGGDYHTTRVSPMRGVQLNDQQVVEQHDRWYLEGSRRHGKGRRQVSNATLRLTHAIKDRETGTMHYRGVIRYKGTEIPFIEKLDTVRRKTAEWMAAKMLDAEAGVLAVGAMRTNLHQIAVLFHEPVFVVDDLYKWVERLKAGEQDPAPAGQEGQR